MIKYQSKTTLETLMSARAAKRGMTLAEFTAFCDAEHERLQEVARLRYDRDAQRGAIAKRAVSRGGAFVVLEVAR